MSKPFIPTLTVAATLDRMAALRSDAEAVSALRTNDTARFLMLLRGRPAIHSSPDRSRAGIRWLTAGEMHRLGICLDDTMLLGRDIAAGHPLFSVSLVGETAERLERILKPVVDLRSLATQGVMAPEELSLLGVAKALADWHSASGYCCRCGGPTRVTDGGWKRHCDGCDAQWFPRADPVVIMLITYGTRAVLARQSNFPDGMYSLPAGFVEPGEDIEAAVRRETQEEVGLKVGTVRYELSQPWPFPHSLMIGCIATADAPELVVDFNELEAARWFAAEDVAAMMTGSHPDGLWVPGAHAIAHALIARWLGSLGHQSVG